MIRLQAIRLVNWYHFVDETLRLGGSCLLLGDNGTGKSTILDAVQWALVADQQQVRFNKAANEQSRRGLYGYVRYKLGSEDESRPGHLRFGRGTCTSYVMLQFTDERDPAGDFVCGMAMEASEADASVARAHFVVPRTVAGDVPAIAPGDLVRTLRDFRAALREIPQARLFPDGRHLSRRAAAPPRRPPEPSTASSSRPSTSSRSARSAISSSTTCSTSGPWTRWRCRPTWSTTSSSRPRRRTPSAAWPPSTRSALRASGSSRNDGPQRATSTCRCGPTSSWPRIGCGRSTRRSRRPCAGKPRCRRTWLGPNEHLAFLARERDRLTGLLLAAPGYRELQALERDLEEARRTITEAADAEARARRVLEGQRAALETLLSQEARDLRHARPALFPADALVGAGEEPAVVARLRRDPGARWRPRRPRPGDLDRRLGQAADALAVGQARLRDALETAKEEGRLLQAEQAELERGRQRYPEGVDALLHLLRTRLNGAREPRPAVRADRGDNARAGETPWRATSTRAASTSSWRPRTSRARSRSTSGTSAATRCPDAARSSSPASGLVDIERIQALAPRPEPRSLAEQVTTDDPLARAYVDFLLGDVICCDDEQELRRHRRAITDTVMVYQNHVARQTPPEHLPPPLHRRRRRGRAAATRSVGAWPSWRRTFSTSPPRSSG